MCKDTITLIVSIATVLISIATFSVAYSQMKIASAKTKLDLYNKRFAVYVSALDYYHATWNEPHDKIKERGNQFVKFYRESQFLFEPSDGVYETLGKILQNGSQIQAYKQHKYERENDLTKDRLDLDRMHETSMNAGFDFEKNLKTLEQQIEKYIQFKNITGWKFFR
jgi:hypothetical protein